MRIVWFTAIVCATLGCSSSKDAPAVTPSAAMVSASFECVDPGKGGPPAKWQASIANNKIERCILAGDSMTVGLEEGPGSYFRMAIRGFKGPGSYTANSVEGVGSYVDLRAVGNTTEAKNTDVGTGSGECTASCTIKVTEAKVTEAAVGAKGSFVAEVDCPTLANAAIACVTCTPTSSTIARLKITECEHAE